MVVSYQGNYGLAQPEEQKDLNYFRISEDDHEGED